MTRTKTFCEYKKKKRIIKEAVWIKIAKDDSSDV